MNKLLILLLMLTVLGACVKDKELIPVNQQPPVTTTPQDPPKSLGTFMMGVHATSGTVKVVEDVPNKKTYLVFENFKTDAGPDLRVYLAEDNKATGFVEVNKLANTGNFNLEIPSSANLDKQKYVLIWCKQFTVLFGYAQLK